MKLSAVMSNPTMRINETSTVTQAATKMAQGKVGALPVMRGVHVVGLLTDRDIVVRCVASGRDPGATAVKAVMTPGMVSCFVDQTLDDAACIMEQNHIRRLLVVGRDRRLAGILSLGDIAVRQPNPVLTGGVAARTSHSFSSACSALARQRAAAALRRSDA